MCEALRKMLPKAAGPSPVGKFERRANWSPNVESQVILYESVLHYMKVFSIYLFFIIILIVKHFSEVTNITLDKCVQSTQSNAAEGSRAPTTRSIERRTNWSPKAASKQ